MRRLGQTPSQTVGPYFSMRLAVEGDNVLSAPGVEGERIRIEGRLLDGDRQPIEDGLIEIWQANAGGRYRHPDDARDAIAIDPRFTGFGRAATGFDDGGFWFETIKPGAVPGPGGALQAPHVNVALQARGMLNASFTRIYFSDEVDANRRDRVLASVPGERRATLIAEHLEGSREPRRYRIVFRFQGEDETVFFDF